MKKVIIFIGIGISTISVIIFFLIPTPDPKRDKLIFKDTIQDVELSLLKLSKILEKLPEPADGNTRYYHYYGGNLFLNNQFVGILNLDSLAELKMLDENEKYCFLKEINFLKNNYISSGGFNNEFNSWTFSYRELESESWSQSREIILLNTELNNENLYETSEIIDLKLPLILVKTRETFAEKYNNF